MKDYMKRMAEIRSVLTPDLLKPNWRLRFDPANVTAGHCYAASEAMWHMGAREEGFVPHVARDHAGGTHWWLQHPDGRIYDPTLEQYLSVGQVPPYSAGRGCGFLTRQPSRRAAIIIERVLALATSPAGARS